MPPFRRQLHIIRMRAQDAGLVGVRKRRPHRSYRERMQAFGVARMRYLGFVPLLLLLTLLVAWIKMPPLTQARYRPVRHAINNPLSGWAVDATLEPESVEIEHSLVHATLTWRQLEPEEGNFDFEAFERENHVSQWRALGKRMVLRFVLDRPEDQAHMDIPDWLFEAMGEEAGAAYETWVGFGFSPAYDNPLLIQKHGEALAKLGERYNADPFLAFLEIGSLGHNGEWWVDREHGVSALPLFSEAQEYIGAYSYAFPDTSMLAVSPYRQVRLIGAGLYNPFLGDADLTWNWIDNATYGGYDENIGTDLRGMGEFFRSAPAGAQISRYPGATSLIGDMPERLIDQLRECHSTYVSGAPARELSNEIRIGMRVAQELMGYRLWVRSAQWPSAVRHGESFRSTLWVRNSGVAPMSQAWPLRISLIRDGEEVCGQFARLDVTTLMPGESRVDLDLEVPIDLPAGDYQIGVAICDPQTRLPAVELAMVTKREGLTSILGEIRVVR